MVQAGIFQEEDILPVFAEGNVQGVVRVNATATALEAVDVRPDRADVTAIVQPVNAHQPVAVGDEEVFAAGLHRQRRAPAVAGVGSVRLVVERQMDCPSLGPPGRVGPMIKADQHVAGVFLGAGRTTGDHHVVAGDVKQPPKPVAGELRRVLVGHLGSPAIDGVAVRVETFARQMEDGLLPRALPDAGSGVQVHETPAGLPFHGGELRGVRGTVAVAVSPDEGFPVLRPTLAVLRAPGGGTRHIPARGGNTALAELVDLQAASALGAAVEEEFATDPSHAIDQAMARAVEVGDTTIERILEAINGQSGQVTAHSRAAGSNPW